MMWQTTLWLTATLQLVSTNEFQLPGDARPKHYDLRLVYDVDPASNFSYFGIVDILLSVNKPTSKIVLHAAGFTIGSDGIILTGRPTPPKPITAQFVNRNDFLIISFDGQLQINIDYTLTIMFYGNLKQGLGGVYISTYVDNMTRRKEYLIATHFEPIQARKGFPCFDEPMYKTTFRITIGHHRNFTAISNMPLKSTFETNILVPHWPWDVIQQKFNKDISQFVWDEFDKSVPMSTYLVAFVISKFAYVDSPPGLSRTKFRIWARRVAINQTSYAAEIGPRLLSHFEKLFDIPFPLPKMDMIAIPDFSDGAMGNWGLITYSEDTLLYDKEQSSLRSKAVIAETIAHEIAHQWFGNLVTMKCWSQLWLKEGLATFFDAKSVAAMEPTWGYETNAIVTNLISALEYDALESSHPVTINLVDPAHFLEIYDDVSYSKGSALVRMINMILGDAVFIKGIQNYLMKYSYKIAEQDDLWREFTTESQTQGLVLNVTIKDVMDTWTEQTGYPLLTVTRNYTDTSLAISQIHFLPLPLRRDSSSWWIPLRVLCEPDNENRREALMWLAKNQGVSSLQHFQHYSNSNQWVLFNHDVIAPYRVNYDDRNWRLLSYALNNENYTNVPILGRVQLVTDALELAWTNRLNYSTALRLTNYLRHEKEYLPLMAGLEKLDKIRNILSRTPDYGAFQKYMRLIITKTYEFAGGLAAKKIIDKDNYKSVLLQELTSTWACHMKVPGCEENAIELFHEWMNSKYPDTENPIPVDLQSIVYEVAISRGNEQHWQFAFARQKNTDVETERDLLLSALANTREMWILKQYLEMVVTKDSEIRAKDAVLVITEVTRSPVGYYVAKEFIYNRIENIYDAIYGETSMIIEIFETLLSQFTTQDELDEFAAWQEDHEEFISDAEMAINHAIELAAVNIEWVTNNQPMVVDLLREMAGDEKKITKRMRGGAINTQTPAALLTLATFIIIYLL